MYGSRFDGLARTITRGTTRRAALRGMLGGVLAVAGWDAIGVSAKPVAKEKVALCHLDAATGAYSIVSVPAQAVDAHLRHGDVLVTELDTASDPQHCGGCGITCPEGTTCIDGVCTAEQVTPAPTTIHGILAAGGPVIVLDTCSAPIEGAPYVTHQIEHPGGPISLELTGIELFDPALILFPGTTLPADMCQGRVGGDDDCGVGVNAYVETTLKTGTYTAIVTGYAGEPYGSYMLELYSFSGGEASQFCPP
jgi:hypothetical protein